ncbi:hypothetical protein SDRG_11783 [Saprolegnia diclina VS20]|uniref:Protein kinase domain-containing protein n=1 Tax=Saprolegnia diclina (strain VS20) TaxID=1156394 RepID=T0QAF6_SAPDV|nr:hypothetical protein SDRG_11783 [Saprolegnia diclina VS20]EQC30465.1 hypothetical protein SDRG_11783 [Saprolegnia diclina VS20]|eukprot:XP_008616058.1 hypothetical protein SDRG_11783 [Saprolegnia diclina VS20]
MTTGKGTPYWTAPEVYTSGSNYSFAADIYAFGVILSELDTLLLPYADVPGINFWGIMDRVRNGTLRPSLTPTCAPWLKELATACFASDPTQRPTAHDVVNVLERQLNHANSEMPPTLLRRKPSASTPLIAQVAPVSRQQDSSLGSSAPLSASHLLSRIPEVELTPHESPPESGNAKTDAGGSIEKVVANDLICQRCTATNSFLDDACETCHESLPPSSQRLALFVERLEVAAAQGLRVESTIPCHTCSTAYPMTTAECDDCGDAFPADTVKIRMLLKRLELARSSNPIV